MTRAPEPADTGEQRLLAACEASARFFRRQLFGDAGAVARAYLRTRGLGQMLSGGQRFRLGYAPAGRRALTAHLGALGFTAAEIEAAGLASRWSASGALADRFRDRLMIPLNSPHGPIGFIGRVLPGAPETASKYLNSPTTALYTKGRHLLGLVEQADRLATAERVLVVEGPLDALAAATSTPVPGADLVAICTCGTALTEHHIALLEPLAGRITLGFDGDTGGRSAAERAYARFAAAHWTRELDGVILPRGADPASLRELGGPRALPRVVEGSARPLDQVIVILRIDEARERLGSDFRHIETRVNLARSLAPFAAAAGIPHTSVLTGIIADRLRLPLSAVVGYVVDELTEMQRR